MLKPGAHILAFGGTRTYHRMVCAVEDAGFTVIDMVEWIYGSGFPKSLDISKQLDKAAGVEPEVIGKNPNASDTCGNINICKKNGSRTITVPSTEEAIQYNGFGSALKPSHEPILLARKPISERNIAANVLRYGTGGINIAGCRIGYKSEADRIGGQSERNSTSKGQFALFTEDDNFDRSDRNNIRGRFPSNLLLECCCEDDELVGGGMGEPKIGAKPRSNVGFKLTEGNRDRSELIVDYNDKGVIHTNPNCVCRMLDEQSGECASGYSNNNAEIGEEGLITPIRRGKLISRNDKGGASRFFYQPKASQNERWFYCTICKKAYPMKERDKHTHNAPEETKYKYLEFHPTQKPESLLCYLMRLITPPNGTTIDPFLGSGTAIIAAEREGFNCVGIDSKPEYCEMAFRRGKSGLIQQKITGTPSTIEKEGF